MNLAKLIEISRSKSAREKKYDFETSTKGGDGWVAFAEEPYRKTTVTGAGKDGRTVRTEKAYRTLYRKTDGIGGGGSNSSTKPDKRSTGDYDDIVNSLKIEQQAASKRAEELRLQQAAKYQKDFSDMTARYDEQINQLNAANAANLDALNIRYDEQTAAFNEFQTAAADQLATAEANYQDQRRMTENLQSAFVPEPNPNAFKASVGDQRNQSSRQERNNRLSDLSSLSIVSGLGTASNPLSGLQLA